MPHQFVDVETIVICGWGRQARSTMAPRRPACRPRWSAFLPNDSPESPQQSHCDDETWSRATFAATWRAQPRLRSRGGPGTGGATDPRLSAFGAGTGPLGVAPLRREACAVKTKRKQSADAVAPAAAQGRSRRPRSPLRPASVVAHLGLAGLPTRQFNCFRTPIAVRSKGGCHTTTDRGADQC